jgi:NADPH-dependent curcumin reductase CurA
LPEVEDGAVVARTLFLSVDPTNRVWMKDVPQYMPPVAIGEVMRSGGLAEVGEGDTAVVTAAAGSVGSAAGQIAKIRGARVVGIAGGADKARKLVEHYGFDAGVDSRAPDFRDRLKAATPDGVDVLFENVGGEVMEAAIARMNARGRIALSGMISIYNGQGGTRYDWSPIMAKRLKVLGFILIDGGSLGPREASEVAGWVLEGKIKAEETIVDGLEQAPEALNMLFDGANVGKLLVRVA